MSVTLAIDDSSVDWTRNSPASTGDLGRLLFDLECEAAHGAHMDGHAGRD